MSKVLNLQLTNENVKPVFEVSAGAELISCMLDTGAEMPVWCGAKELFVAAFPDAVLYENKFILGGFGGKGALVDVYRIPCFSILGMSDDTGVVFQNMYCAVQFDRGFGCDLILSATLFGKMDYTILNRISSLDRRLRLEYDKDSYTVGVKLKKDFVKNIYTFIQK